MDTAYGGYDKERSTNFYRELERRVRELPGVESVSLCFHVPLNYKIDADTVEVEGRPPATGREKPVVMFNRVTPDYFRTMGFQLRRGRAFRDTDREGAPRVAIVNETMARRLWPDQDPQGKRFRLQRTGDAWWEVVGVARDSKYLTLFEPAQPYFYVPAAQQYSSHRVLQVRSQLPAESLIGRVEAEIRALDPDLPVTEVRTMDEALDSMSGFWAYRLGSYLSGAMGLVGLALAVVGVFRRRVVHGWTAHTGDRDSHGSGGGRARRAPVGSGTGRGAGRLRRARGPGRCLGAGAVDEPLVIRHYPGGRRRCSSQRARSWRHCRCGHATSPRAARCASTPWARCGTSSLRVLFLKFFYRSLT